MFACTYTFQILSNNKLNAVIKFIGFILRITKIVFLIK